MELADLTKNFGSLSNLLTDWLNCLRHPLKCCEQQLFELETEDAKIKRAVSTWMTSFVITLVILLPLYALIGIDLKKVEFHLPAFVILFLSFLCSGMASHIGFRLARINSQFADTFLIQAITVSCYTPLLTLMGYPSYLRLLMAMKEAKVHHLGMVDTLKGIFTPTRGDDIGAIFEMLGSVLLPLAFFPIAVFAEATSRRYAVNRAKILSSLSFSTAVLYSLPSVALSALYFFVIYIFTGEQATK
jgi:uncharacterized integral membrane protein